MNAQSCHRPWRVSRHKSLARAKGTIVNYRQGYKDQELPRLLTAYLTIAPFLQIVSQNQSIDPLFEPLAHAKSRLSWTSRLETGSQCPSLHPRPRPRCLAGLPRPLAAGDVRVALALSFRARRCLRRHCESVKRAVEEEKDLRRWRIWICPRT